MWDQLFSVDDGPGNVLISIAAEHSPRCYWREYSILMLIFNSVVEFQNTASCYFCLVCISQSLQTCRSSLTKFSGP